MGNMQNAFYGQPLPVITTFEAPPHQPPALLTPLFFLFAITALYGKLNLEVHLRKSTLKFLDRLHILGLLTIKAAANRQVGEN